MQLFNYATSSFFPEHNFRRWAKLTSSFLVLSILLEQQTWFQVCVVPLVPITFRFTIHLTWCHRRSITSWNLSTKCVVIIINLMSSSRISIEFMMRNTILALDDLRYHRPLYCLPTNTSLFVFDVIPWVPCYLAIVLPYLGTLTSFMSRTSWEFHHVLRVLGIVITSHPHHSFLVLVLIPTGVPTSERCSLDSALLATLLIWS